MFNRKRIKYFFIIICVITILYPLVNIYLIFPSFSQLIVRNSEEEAIRIAKSLSAIVVSVDNELKEPEVFSSAVIQAMEEFSLAKIKVFSKSGKVIYSNETTDIGSMNNKPYFHEIVAEGSPYTKVVQKDTNTLEDQIMKVDVVETYVPIMRNMNFLGAFEIYFDITALNHELNKQVFRSSLIILLLMLGFFILIVLLISKSERNNNEQVKNNTSASYQFAFYQILVMVISIFIAEVIVMLFMYKFPPLTKINKALIDSVLLVMMVSPVFYYVLFRPLILHIEQRKKAEENLRKAHGDLAQANIKLKYENIERKNMEDKLRAMSLTDELTGLYNRRGFFTLVEQQIKVFKRQRKRIFLLYADLDKFKEINDTFGHKKGDEVLIEAADILKSTYRKSDLIARIGGDEFVVFPVGNDEEYINVIIARLQKKINEFNAQKERDYKLSMSVGVAPYDPDYFRSVDELLSEADGLMYKQKRQKQNIQDHSASLVKTLSPLSPVNHH